MKTIFDIHTGQLLSTHTDNTDVNCLLSANTHVFVTDHVPRNQYLDLVTLKLVEIPKQTGEYFDYTTKTWRDRVETPEYLGAVIREQRSEYLKKIDNINPVWYSELTVNQKRELKTYRQALLDITDQETYPLEVTWPVMPEWLK